MSITFRCEHCHKEVEAPDAAAGKRGRCPFCQQTSYIPAPVQEEDVLDLAPIDEEEERARQEKIKRLRDAEHDLIAETGAVDGSVPLEQRDDLTTEDLHHFVVNYCLDMAGGKLERAERHAEKLKGFGRLGFQVVKEFQSGQATEEALADIPEPVQQGFFKQLLDAIS